MSAAGRSASSAVRRNREEELYDVARRLFAEYGFPTTTLDHIASELDIHKSTLFHYVASKQDLLATVLDRGLRGYLDELTAIAGRSDASAVDRLRLAVRNHLNFVLLERDALVVFLRERKHLRGNRGEAYLEAAKKYESLMRGIVQEGVDSGDLRTVDVDVSIKLLLGACNWMVEWYEPTGRVAAGEMQNIVVELLVDRMLSANGDRSARLGA